MRITERKRDMILIADSGATKTDWMTVSKDSYRLIGTEGINPFHQTEDYIRNIINSSLLPKMERENICIHNITEVHFYGAGCLPQPAMKISNILKEVFPKATVEAETDLTGAARALCGNRPGIACILGTGSNSCMYDGERIIANVSPLGYILGDEGSGAYLGKRFISDCLKNQLPEYLKTGLLEEYALTTADILNKVYREPQANRFLASITPYIYKARKDPNVETFLNDCFTEFFKRNIMGYDTTLDISFAGSIAWFFQEEVKKAAISLGLRTGVFMKEPIWGLKDFHTKINQ